MTKNTHKPIRVVIIGAGFAGIHAYLELHKQLHHTRRLEITLVNKTDYFTFIPMIHEVATGLLLPSSITQPIRTLAHCCLKQFIEGEVQHINYDTQTVRIMHGNLECTDNDDHTPAQRNITVEYDYLIQGLGSKTNFFGVPGAAEHALPLKTLDDARHLKNHVIESFQDAGRLADPEQQKNALRFVIVGGGPTGVELAGELADMIENELSRAFPKLHHLAQVIIIERGTGLVKAVDPWFGEKTEDILEKNSYIYIMYETSVEEVTHQGVQTSKGFIDTGLVVWSGGVTAHSIDYQAKENIEIDERSQRIKVTPELHLTEYPNVYVAGDQAWIYDSVHDQPYPMRAQFAVRQGHLIGQNIARVVAEKDQQPFNWHEKGFIMSLGRGGALAELFGMKLSGPFAWFLYRTAYLYSIVGLRAKLRTALEWTLNLFSPRDISKI